MTPDVMGIIFDPPFTMGVYLVFLASLSIINMARPGHPVMLGTWGDGVRFKNRCI